MRNRNSGRRCRGTSVTFSAAGQFLVDNAFQTDETDPSALTYLNKIVAIDSEANTVTLADPAVHAISASDTVVYGGLSGNTYSFKLSCQNCTVDGYISNRPEGFMDVLTLDNVQVSNVTANYNSQFNWGFWAGAMVSNSSGGTTSNLTFRNLKLTDVASVSQATPIASVGTFENVTARLNKFDPSTKIEGSSALTCTITGVCDLPRIAGVTYEQGL